MFYPETTNKSKKMTRKCIFLSGFYRARMFSCKTTVIHHIFDLFHTIKTTNFTFVKRADSIFSARGFVCVCV